MFHAQRNKQVSTILLGLEFAGTRMNDLFTADVNVFFFPLFYMYSPLFKQAINTTSFAISMS